MVCCKDNTTDQTDERDDWEEESSEQGASDGQQRSCVQSNVSMKQSADGDCYCFFARNLPSNTKNPRTAINKLAKLKTKTARNGSRQRKIIALDSIETDGFTGFTFREIDEINQNYGFG